MEIFKPGINVDFVGKRYIAFAISGISILLTILFLIWRGGPNYGVDFAGGIVVQVKLEKGHTPSEVREALKPIDLGDSIIQEFGEKSQNEYLIRVTQKDVQLTGLDEKVKKALAAQIGGNVEIRRVEMVGPQVGEDLTRKALYAILGALLMMGVYITGRFQNMWLKSSVVTAPIVLAVLAIATFRPSVTGVIWLIVLAMVVTVALYWFMNLKYALGAVISLIHDVAVVIGAFALDEPGDRPHDRRGPADDRRVLHQRHDRRLRSNPGERGQDPQEAVHRNHQPQCQRDPQQDPPHGHHHAGRC